MRAFAVLLLSLGELLMTTSGGTWALIGLGIWWFAVLVLLDLLIGGGWGAQILWAVASAGTVLVTSTDLPQAAVSDSGQPVIWVATGVMALSGLLRTTKPTAEPEAETGSGPVSDAGSESTGGLASRPPDRPEP
jgi:hypothetical protein